MRESNIADFMTYRRNLSDILLSLNVSSIDSAAEVLLNAIFQNANIFLIGNGGSAALIEHAQCDLSKGIFSYAKSNSIKLPLVYALTSPLPLISALGNDLGHENIFSWQLEHRAIAGDILIAVSSSGNSRNIINAVKVARKIGVVVIGFSGFFNSDLKNLSDIDIHVPSENYGVIEDIHGIILHSLTQRIRASIS